jgi:hypothetical protein
MNDIIYRRMVEDIDNMTLSAKLAYDAGDWKSLHYWISAIHQKSEGLSNFMETRIVGE